MRRGCRGEGAGGFQFTHALSVTLRVDQVPNVAGEKSASRSEDYRREGRQEGIDTLFCWMRQVN